MTFSSRNPWWTLATVSLAGMMVGIDGTALTIAGPSIATSVGASLGELQWIANAYLLALAVTLFPAGRLADRAGRRRMFLIGVLGFGAASLLLAAASESWLLIALRAVQGACGAMLQTAALALVRATFPPKRLELALGVWGGASALALAAGPIFAGVLVAHLGWPVVFLVNAPVALVVGLLTRLTVAESRTAATPPKPVVLVRSPGVLVGAALIGLSHFSLFGLLFFLTLYLQNVRGLDPVGAGEWLLPLMLVIVLSAPLGGVLTGRFGPRWPAAGGLALVCAGMLGFLGLGPATRQGEMLPWALVLGLGTGLAIIAATQVVVAGAPAAMAGLASALQQVATQLGGVLGIVLLGFVMSWQVGRLLPAGGAVDEATQGRGPGALAFVSGFHAAVIVGSVVIAAGAVLAMVAVRRPAPETATAEPLTVESRGF
jgi:predicted MFS family arabinose efflux permease